MISSRVVATLVFISVAGCASLNAKREVLRLNEQLVRAIGNHDTARLRELTASDFKISTLNGDVGREQWLAAISAGHFVLQPPARRFVTVDNPDSVNVCGRQHEEIVGFIGEYCDQWTKRNGRWQLVSALPIVYAQRGQ